MPRGWWPFPRAHRILNLRIGCSSLCRSQQEEFCRCAYAALGLLASQHVWRLLHWRRRPGSVPRPRSPLRPSANASVGRGRSEPSTASGPTPSARVLECVSGAARIRRRSCQAARSTGRRLAESPRSAASVPCRCIRRAPARWRPVPRPAHRHQSTACSFAVRCAKIRSGRRCPSARRGACAGIHPAVPRLAWSTASSVLVGVTGW